jgi:preprotein translocase subunit YajC
VKKLRIEIMFQKLTPLIILGLFVVAMYFMMQGTQKALHMTKVKHEIKK